MYLRSKTARAHRRKPRLELQPEDFDNVRYNIELVRVADGVASNDSALSGPDLVEVAVAVVLALGLLGGCVAIGVSVDVLEFAHEDLCYLLPMLALPLAWLLALHVYEKQVAARPIEVAATSPPKIATT